MRFLADAGISPKTIEFLKQLGHDAVHVRTLGLQSAPDPDLVGRARADSVNQRLSTVLAEQLSALASGALILVEDARYRVRKLPIGRT